MARVRVLALAYPVGKELARVRVRARVRDRVGAGVRLKGQRTS